ncbi:bifunctional protein includes folylpolyglutamate synthase (FPGS) dihydrofolate synthase [Marinobacter santoriniensis NKSG1]|uniref:Dihydrofolate synthase/folylpolyglutamate synthase n=1 Tax=Marinobacter santoriniensis NKSG1 TaxID=1288826 RepID=M7D442_9GAMM|nr:bifunctional tetrahydrofolate synthase/dihydrofolate synthase [Marinobacter santoriniensis]EMP55498.1 bifunctional protein includes folylpolyglutamate synthase (FPGS) dihydrofolate synthase [Marinobacter santoriniensis NKSG1]
MPPSSNSVRTPPVPPGETATLEQWLAYLESIHPAEIELGLDRVLLVFRRLFPRKPNARIITVAGTNGKGSTVAALEALLMQAGRRTGAYTSPHLHRYNERVRIAGVDIADDALIRAFNAVEQARRNVSLTYFEFGTLASFVAFAEAGVEDWVLEVGLGGRLDAVNVLDADFAIITSIDIDHVAFLGDDREVIGFEKAGILRPGIRAVFADDTPPRSVLQQVHAQRVTLTRLGEDYTIRHSPSSGVGEVELVFQGETIRMPAGPLPVKSMAAAVVAVRTLEPALPVSVVEHTLAGLSLPGRFETISSSPRVIVDVGHNPHAASWLASQLDRLREPGGKIFAVFAALGDKDVEGVVRALESDVDEWYIAPLDVPRGLGVEALAQRLEAVGLAPVHRCQSVEDALAQAEQAAAESDLIVATGSFYTVGQARTALKKGAS